MFLLIDNKIENPYVNHACVLLVATGKETIDSWRTAGTVSDIVYTMAGSVFANWADNKLKKKVHIRVEKKKVRLAINF